MKRVLAAAVLALLVACQDRVESPTAVSNRSVAGRVSGTIPSGGASRAISPLAAEATGLQPVATITGRVSLSIDGLGTHSRSGTVQVRKPAGATVRRAYLAAASTGSSGRELANGDVRIGGVGVVWARSVPSLIGSWNHWADVTSIVKARIDAAPAGRLSFTITEVSTEGIDGEVLAVVFDDPSQTTDNTVALLFGAQDPLGDDFLLSTGRPLDPSNPALKVDMSLGISFSFQPDPAAPQASQVEANGRRVSSCAGGQDDGAPDGGDGALLTVGGLGDDDANPDPACSGGSPAAPRLDDELYGLTPFIRSGDTRIAVHTVNPSRDDNLFFAAFFMTVPGEVTAGDHAVTVTVTNRVGAGAVVTAKNLDTGEYTPKLTDADGVATFTLADGSYLFHARNLADLGPLFAGVPLVLAPLPDSSRLLNTAPTEDLNRVGVLYDPSVASHSVVLNPPNYERLTASPPLVLTPRSGDLNLTLAFRTGATVACTLRDSDGSVLSVPTPENLFLIFPFEAGAALPPPPPEFIDSPLPPAILASATTVPAGGSGCSLSGVPATTGFAAVLESNTVLVDGVEKTFLQQVQVTPQQAASGATVPVVLVAEPRRAHVDYVPEPFGDANGLTDLGVISYGWGVSAGDVSDTFIVGARFRGLGVYTLDLRYGGTRARIDARCSSSGCVLARKLPSGLEVSVTGAVSGSRGTVIVSVGLPGVTRLSLRLLTGSPGADDYAPDAGLVLAEKPPFVDPWLVGW